MTKCNKCPFDGTHGHLPGCSQFDPVFDALTPETWGEMAAKVAIEKAETRRPSPPAEPKCKRCGHEAKEHDSFEGRWKERLDCLVGVASGDKREICSCSHYRPPTPEPAESEGKHDCDDGITKVGGIYVPCPICESDTTVPLLDKPPTAPPAESVEDRAFDDAFDFMERDREFDVTKCLPDEIAGLMARYATKQIERQTPAIIDQKQSDVWRWCEETFEGIAAWQTDKERAYRFFEEAGELFQAMGMEREDAIKVVDYVYGRPIGELSQEIGGVMVTLFALASQQKQSVSESFETEYQRIIRPEIQAKIRNKQLAKNQAFL